MSKRFITLLWFIATISTLFSQLAYADSGNNIIVHPNNYKANKCDAIIDSASARVAVLDIISTIIKASSNFDIDAVANLYTPNAVVADEEPPFSWNGPTAGVQWINTVEKTCKDFKLKNFKAKAGQISIYLQTDESIYVVVPVEYTGQVRGDRFEEDGAFTFVFRMVNGRWLIKSQVWVARKGM